MTIANFLRDKLLILLLNGISLFLLLLYLLAIGNSGLTCGLITCFWLTILIVWLVISYHQRRRYFQDIINTLDNLEKPYLIQEFMGQSWRLEDQLYQQILRQSNKAVIEKIQAIEEEQQDYREFIEGWIHEVKLPITGMRLTAHNQTNELRRKLEIYLTEMDEMVEQALFYARSEEVYKDYAIKETDLRQVVLQVLGKSKYLLIQHQMTVDPLVNSVFVQTDEKWVAFILGQLVTNALKYKKDGSGAIAFIIEETDHATRLSLKDNGIGIPETELRRVFDKGFTGTNGRKREKTTGIGLYLCQKLCKKLELGLEIDSKEGAYTIVTLSFPKNTYLSKL
ncbi:MULTISPECIES: sensor histidine kinase [Enterococcus]|uniref:histidine kinase n=1 Tax=Candidatus Enterococcus ferrettii TaxID=2815324 RepID=A0ABV0EU10_9ENTE|nr:sensor histidine kinase [Enterococcus sp. 665A]MBO1339566.1 sensor histidine kinase [Enterococcus sp. 665A]